MSDALFDDDDLFDLDPLHEPARKRQVTHRSARNGSERIWQKVDFWVGLVLGFYLGAAAANHVNVERGPQSQHEEWSPDHRLID